MLASNAPSVRMAHLGPARLLGRLVRALGWNGSPAVGLGLLIVIGAACVLRAGGLPDVPGTLARDESRLALAARGMLEQGFPLMPGGIVYTRGLLPAAIEAGVFALLGVSDQAARLPALVAGTLVIPATYWLARPLVGGWPALAAAAIVALSPPLIEIAREAWLYSWLTLWTLVCLGWLVRARRDPCVEPRLYAGLAFTAAALSHELALLLLPAVALADALARYRVRPSRAAKQPPLPLGEGRSGESSPGSSKSTWPALKAFWIPALLAALAALFLTALLRAPTGGGGGSEFSSYLRTAVDFRGLLSTLRLVGAHHPWLAPVASVALAVLLARARWRSAIWLPLLAAILILVFNGLVLTRRGHPRDIQALLPLLAILACYATWRFGPFLLGAAMGARLARRRERLLGAGLTLLLVVASVNIGGLWSVARPPSPAPTWLQAMAAYQPDDLIMSFAPTESSHALGVTDFWLRPNGFSRYVWSGPAPFRDVYTGAVVIRNVRDLEILVLTPHPGRTLWVIAQRSPPAEQRMAIGEILARLAPLVTDELPTNDGSRVLRIRM